MNETLEELSIINFPKDIDEREAYRILEFVSDDLNYRISLGNFSGYFSIEDGELSRKYEAEIRGLISSKDYIERADFSFSRDTTDDENSVFSGIRFNTIPGCNLEEHDQGDVEAWRKIKESVVRYFEK